MRRSSPRTAEKRRLDRLVVGSHVFHPTCGVASVTAVEEGELGGERHQFYVLELAVGGRLLLPTDKVRLSGLRRLISTSRARQLVSRITTEPAIDEAPLKQRIAVYADALRSGAAAGYTETLRQLLFRARAKPLSLTERRLLATAQAYFVGEISFVLERSAEKLEALLRSVTDPSNWA